MWSIRNYNDIALVVGNIIADRKTIAIINAIVSGPSSLKKQLP